MLYIEGDTELMDITFRGDRIHLDILRATNNVWSKFKQ